MKCEICGENMVKNGTEYGIDGRLYQKFRCKSCRTSPRTLIESTQDGVTPTGYAVDKPLEKEATLKGKILSLGDIRSKHNLFYQMDNFLKSIKIGEFYEEAEFLRISGIGTPPSYRSVLNSSEFDKYRALGGKCMYVGNPDSISEAISEGSLNPIKKN